MSGELKDELKDELREMRGLLESQLATLAWNGRQPEPKARALREMLAAGFSAGLSRYIAERMPTVAMESEYEDCARTTGLFLQMRPMMRSRN